MNRRRILTAFALAVIGLAASPAPGHALDKSDIMVKADHALKLLAQSEPMTVDLGKKAHGILIFPEILKAGVLIGGAGGNGVLRVGGKVDGYYNSAAVSYGLQFGVSKFGYVMFLMDKASLQYVRETAGWEVGVGPSITVADKGMATKLSSSTLQDGIFVFFVDQSGFFAGGGVEGSKITRLSE